MLLLKLKTTNRLGKLRKDVLVTCNHTGNTFRVCLHSSNRGQIILAFEEPSKLEKNFYFTRVPTILDNNGQYLTNEEKSNYENN